MLKASRKHIFFIDNIDIDKIWQHIQPLPSDLSAIPMVIFVNIRFHKLKSLAGSNARDARASTDSELVAYGNST